MQKKEQHGGKIHKDGQHQTTPHTLQKLKIIKRERSRRHRGPSPRMLHQEQYHTGSEERGVDTSGAYAVTMHLRAPARHIRYTIFEEGHYLLAWIEGAAPSQDEMDAAGRWPHREGQRIPNETRRLSLSRTSPLHTSNTGGGSFTSGQEGHTVAAARHPQAPADHKAHKAEPSRRERRREHRRRPTKLGLSPGRPRGRGSKGVSPYRRLQGGERHI
jgi:hypothetical protein